jgi:hypothetical protein
MSENENGRILTVQATNNQLHKSDQFRAGESADRAEAIIKAREAGL